MQRVRRRRSPSTRWSRACLSRLCRRPCRAANAPLTSIQTFCAVADKPFLTTIVTNAASGMQSRGRSACAFIQHVVCKSSAVNVRSPPRPPRVVAASGKAPGLCRLAAMALAATTGRAADSPIVLAGTVRLTEFALIVLDRLAVYLPLRRADRRTVDWHYAGAIVAIAAARDARLPGRRHLSGAGVPRLREAIYAARLGLVGRLPARHRRHRSSPRPGDQFSRVWLGSFYVLGLLALLARARTCSLLVRHWTREGRLDAPHRHRRRRRRRRRVIEASAPRRRTPASKSSACSTTAATSARRRRMRRRAQARQRRRSGRVRPPHARRSRDLLAADLGRRAASCRC